MIQNKAEALEIITGYIIECRDRGHFLTYSDHEIIEGWINQANQLEGLLGVLHQVIPEYYEQNAHKTCPPKLEHVDKEIKSRLLEKAMLHSNSKVI